MKKYVIGCDFGTLSMRALLVDSDDGSILAEDVYEYSNGVITGSLPGLPVKLEGPAWALQDPDDYLRALTKCIPTVVRESGASPGQVVGIAVDFTTCTVVPMDKNGNALCNDPAFRDRPHAWVKLWKNHTAQKEADDINSYVRENKLDILDSNGLRASSEYFFPKVLEIFRKDREVYDAAHTFMEGGDFTVSKLCGKPVRGGVTAGAKGFYDNYKKSYPDKAFFRGLEPGFENVVRDKHLVDIMPVGAPAGNLCPEMARSLGLTADTVICVPHADAAVAPPGCGIVKPNVMALIMGTSTCHIMMSEKRIVIPGISAVFYEGVLPGYYTYEGGQSAVGDIFEWFCQHYFPAEYAAEAEKRGLSALELMGEKAAKLEVGQSGVVALDWMNGNRCLLQNSDLSGLIVGLTLATKPEEVYRALLEATAFGTKVIIDRFIEYGIAVNEAYACGGLAHKSPLLMQMYADVLGIPIKISAYKHTSAQASAMFAAVAAGVYDDYETAASMMIPAPSVEYMPDPANSAKYSKLFDIYKELHDYFGADGGALMKKLKLT